MPVTPPTPPFDNHRDFSYSTVAVAPADPLAATESLTIHTGDGDYTFPDAPFDVVIWPQNARALRSNAVLAKCTSRTADTLTFTRQVGAYPITLGMQVAASITALTIQDIENSISTINAGEVDGVTTERLPMFYNETSQSLKIYINGTWLTLAQVSFDSLWDSNTDLWDSNAMSWDSPNS